MSATKRLIGEGIMTMMTNTSSTSWRSTAVCALLALVGGLFAGVIDSNATEPQPAALLVLIFAGLLGFAQPRNAWRWAIIVTLGLPLAQVSLRLLGAQPRDPVSPGEYATLIALIPAFIGAYGGVLIRRMSQSTRA
jgi:hypothetical protein